MTNIITHYDEGGDSLVVRKENEKIKQSIALGDTTIDFNADGKVVGVQFLNASEIIWFDDKVEDPVEALKSIGRVELDVKYTEVGVVLRVEIFEEEANEAIATMNNTAPQLTV